MDLNENYFKRVQIHLIDVNKEMTDIWQKHFDLPNVKIHNTDLQTFLTDKDEVDAIVAPANSFGLMTVRKREEFNLKKKCKHYIKRKEN